MLVGANADYIGPRLQRGAVRQRRGSSVALGAGSRRVHYMSSATSLKHAIGSADGSPPSSTRSTFCSIRLQACVQESVVPTHPRNCARVWNYAYVYVRVFADMFEQAISAVYDCRGAAHIWDSGVTAHVLLSANEYTDVHLLLNVVQGLQAL